MKMLTSQRRLKVTDLHLCVHTTWEIGRLDKAAERRGGGAA